MYHELKRNREYCSLLDRMHEQDKVSFEDFQLPSGLLLGLYAMGFDKGPSDIQALILPYSLPDQTQRNIIVQSKTGTGKTVGSIAE